MKLEIVSDKEKTQKIKSNKAKRLISGILSVALAFQAICTIPVFAQAVEDTTPPPISEIVKDDEVKNDEIKDPEIKDPEIKDPEIKDETPVTTPLVPLTPATPIVPLAPLAPTTQPDDSGTALSKITDITKVVKQGGKDIAESGTIDSSKPIAILYSFSVNVKGDDGSTEDSYVKNGETLIFELPVDLTVKTNTGGDLKAADGTAIGTLTYSGKQATITFNSVCEGEGITAVSAKFEAQMSYDAAADQEGQDIPIAIFGKNYTVKVPEAKRTVAVTKSGVADLSKAVINWKVHVTIDKEDVASTPNDGDLTGYIFSDDLTDVGEYTDNTFKTNTTDSDANATTPTPTAEYTNKVLTYTFPDTSTGEEWLYFQTKIPDSSIYANTEQKILNAAKVANDKGTISATGKFDVKFTPQWITKNGKAIEPEDTGGAYDPTNRKIEWTIEANQNGSSLANAIITDVLPDGLTWESAKYSTWDSAASKFVESTTTTFTTEPTDSKYSLGDISTKVQLVITAKVDVIANPTGQIAFKNSASLSWEGHTGGIGVTSANVAVGFNPITKAPNGTYNSSTHEAGWSVTVDTKKLTYGDNLRVLDLLVYEDSGFTSSSYDAITSDTTNNTGFFAMTKENLNNIIDKDKGKLNINYNQKYKTGSFVNTDNTLSVAVHTLTKGGKPVADLLIVSQDANNGISISAQHIFTYSSIITNPRMYAINNQKQKIANTAVLYSSPTTGGATTDTRISSAYAEQNAPSTMIDKDALARTAADTFENAPATPANANGTKGTDDIFDYIDKSIIYRIHVNQNGLTAATKDITATNGTLLGNLTMTDTLPAGWEFKKIGGENGKYFEVFSGATNTTNNNMVDAATHVPDPTAASGGIMTSGSGMPIAAASSNGQTMKFEFTSMESPYVILIKAGPTEKTLKDMFGKNETYGENTTPSTKNNAGLSAVNFSDLANDWESPTITSAVLTKEKITTITEADKNGYLDWKVEYKPYGLIFTTDSMQIVDTLPLGIDLPTDKSGKILFKDGKGNSYIKVETLKLSGDGKYVVDTSATDIDETKCIQYDNATRELTFKIPDNKMPYKLIYRTDITGEAGTTLSNTVKLVGVGGIPTQADGSYDVSQASCSAALTRSGWFSIAKTDASGTGLAGAEFTLYTEDKSTCFRKTTQKKTDDGTFTLRAIPVGKYILKETKAPTDYILDSREYKVEVSKDENDKFIITVDGVALEDTKRNITIKNMKSDTIGNLILKKIVAGNVMDTTKKFNFTITLKDSTDAPITDIYSYIGSGVADGTVTNGSKIELAHNQSITIILPKNIKYTITEDDYAKDGYTQISAKVTAKTKANSSGIATTLSQNGTITVGNTDTITFTNTKNVVIPPPTPDPPPTPTPDPTPDPPPTPTPTPTPTPDPTPTPPTHYYPPATLDGNELLPDTTPIVETPEETPNEPAGETTPEVPAEPNTPEIAPPPSFVLAEVPDPNSPNSPQFFNLVDENGAVLGAYEKRKLPDNTFAYVDVNGASLKYTKNPQMGNNIPVGILVLIMTGSLLGAALLTVYRRKLCDSCDEE